MPSMNKGTAGQDRDAWMRAMHEEVDALGEHAPFRLCYLLAGKKAISGKWVQNQAMGEGFVTKHRTYLMVFLM